MRLWIRDTDMHRIGRVAYRTCQLVDRKNNSGTWQFTMSAHDAEAGLIQRGRGVYAYDGGMVFSGQITGIRHSGDASKALIVSGVTDSDLPRRRIAYPDPAKTSASQDTAAHWSRTGSRETLIRDLVRANLAETARPERRIPTLIAGTSASLGGTAKANLRFDNLMDAINTLAADTLVWRIIHNPDVPRLELHVTQGVDRSRTVKFSHQNGGLLDAPSEVGAPKATHVTVAGQGQGTARRFVERARPSAWGRFEHFQDRRDTNDLAELQQAGDDTLADSAEAGSFTITAVGDKRYGRDYNLGDTVTAILAPGVAESHPVVEADVTWDAGGETTKLTIGNHSPEATTDQMMAARIHDLQARLRRLEGQ